MAGPGSFLAPGQQHQLFRRTAKDLLSLRLVDVNPETRRERELRRLEEQFRDECVALLIRHPTHGVLAQRSIAITREGGVNTFFDDSMEFEV